MSQLSRAVIAATCLIVAGLHAGGAFAQTSATRENVMKTCGDKWRAVKETERPKGVTWSQYLSRCRAEIAKTRGSAPASGSSAASSTASAAKPAAAARASSKGPVFPTEVAARHKSERPALARLRTCSDQFKINKASNANGGLRWIEKGGGYWSRCNAHLKQTRA